MMLRRADTRVIIDALARSEDAEERYAAALALLDVARVATLVVPRDVAERLARDPDEDVAARGAELLGALEGIAAKIAGATFTSSDCDINWWSGRQSGP